MFRRKDRVKSAGEEEMEDREKEKKRKGYRGRSVQRKKWRKLTEL